MISQFLKPPGLSGLCTECQLHCWLVHRTDSAGAGDSGIWPSTKLGPLPGRPIAPASHLHAGPLMRGPHDSGSAGVRRAAGPAKHASVARAVAPAGAVVGRRRPRLLRALRQQPAATRAHTSPHRQGRQAACRRRRCAGRAVQHARPPTPPHPTPPHPTSSDTLKTIKNGAGTKGAALNPSRYQRATHVSNRMRAANASSECGQRIVDFLQQNRTVSGSISPLRANRLAADVALRRGPGTGGPSTRPSGRDAHEPTGTDEGGVEEMHGSRESQS